MVTVRNAFRWSLTLSAAALLSAMVYAQENCATVVVTVTDPQGGVIPNATAKATNIETFAVAATTPNESGLYTLPVLPVGNIKSALRLRA